MEAEELLILLKRIESCLNHNDWINAKEYIGIIKKGVVNENGKHRK